MFFTYHKKLDSYWVPGRLLLYGIINDYNVNAPKFIRYIANTEPVDLDFVDPFIYDDYYNEKIDKYAVKVNLKDNSYMIYKKFLFKNDNSLYLYVRIQILQLIFSLVTIMTFFIYMSQLNKNKSDN